MIDNNWFQMELLKFEKYFNAVEEGDGESKLPEPYNTGAWNEYVERRQSALGGWLARAEEDRAFQVVAVRASKYCAAPMQSQSALDNK